MPPEVTTCGYSVSRTMQALEALAAGEVRTATLAEQLGVHPRTSRRMLQRLVHDGYAVRRRGYRNGFVASAQLRELGERLADEPVQT